jgi:hypothetical protein
MTLRDGFLGTVQAHEAKQTDEGIKVEIDAAREHSISTASNPESSAESVILAKENLLDTLEFGSRGLPPQAKQRYTQEGVSSFHEARVNSLAGVNAESAQIYYDTNKKEILPEERGGLEKVLKVEDTLQFAQQETDRIVAANPDDTTTWLEEARNVKDPDKRKQTVDNVKVRIKENEQATKEAKQNSFLTALNQIDATRTLSEGLDIANRVEDPIDRDKARKHANARFDIKSADTKTIRKRYIEALDKISNREITERNQLLEYAADTSMADFKTLETRFNNKQQRDAGNKVAEASLTTAKNAIAVARGKSVYDPETDDEILLDVLGELDKAAREKGDNLTDLEAAKITADLIVTGEVKGSGWIWEDEKTWLDAVKSGDDHLWLPLMNTEDKDKGEEVREAKGWFLLNTGIDEPSEELMSIYKKKAKLKYKLSSKQNARWNELLKEEGADMGLIEAKKKQRQRRLQQRQ